MAKFFRNPHFVLHLLFASVVAFAKDADSPKPELAPGELPIFARAAMSIDMKTGATLYEKNPDEMEYPASATKILAALVLIEDGNLDKLLTVVEADTKAEPTVLPLVVGEQYPRLHLIYVLLLKSANDVAEALARDNAGSVEAFCEKMNKRAEKAGALNSHFTNPNGLPDPHHFTTARDMAKIGYAAMQNELFRKIVATPGAWMRKGDEWIAFDNHNRLLSKYEGCIGIKTGYTRAAQQVLVSAAQRDGMEVLAVVLHTNKPGIWDDSAMLLDDGFNKIRAKNQPVVPPVTTEEKK